MLPILHKLAEQCTIQMKPIKKRLMGRWWGRGDASEWTSRKPSNDPKECFKMHLKSWAQDCRIKITLNCRPYFVCAYILIEAHVILSFAFKTIRRSAFEVVALIDDLNGNEFELSIFRLIPKLILLFVFEQQKKTKTIRQISVSIDKTEHTLFTWEKHNTQKNVNTVRTCCTVVQQRHTESVCGQSTHISDWILLLDFVIALTSILLLCFVIQAENWTLKHSATDTYVPYKGFTCSFPKWSMRNSFDVR